MIRSVMRSTGAIAASLVVAFALIVGIEVVGAIFHPFPPDVDPNDMNVCRAHVARCPQWLLALSAGGWGVTVFVSSWLATRLGTGRHAAHGIAIGTLLLAAAAFNMWLLPYPLWFDVANYVIFPLATLGAVKLGRGPQAQHPGAEPQPDVSR